ncbi:MAG: aromatic amino acid aminotransferase [Cyanobacteria bacterium PR.3.49]|nr:aromatic amino acid aminotransferase [Cyanobacteria bacterium PR.3.49]
MSQSVSLKPLSKTALEVPFSGIRRFFDIAASMQDVVSLGVGEPDFATPWSVREAAIYSLERGQTTYTSNYGLLELRREIARYLNKRYSVEYNPDSEILVTVGVSEGLDLAMRVLLNPGDEVLVPEPCYVSYKPCVALAGGVPVSVETRSDAKFAVTADQLKAACTAKTKAVLLGYPSNPTGAVLSRERIVEIIAFARDRGLYVISDEIYDRLTYDGIHTCVASVPGARDITILLNGFSKAHAMTGWRIGYACAPEHILKMMMKLHSYTMLCAPITGQVAALEALKHAENEVENMVAHYKQRRRLIVDGLNKLGLTCHMPLGAFYAFPSIESTGLTAEQFAERLLMEERVAVVPGTAFGAGGNGHVRCSYATSVERIEVALARMKKFMDKLS